MPSPLPQGGKGTALWLSLRPEQIEKRSKTTVCRAMRNHRLVHSGMTLVELLVVVAIIVLLLAVSVPILKPMLDSRKTYNAAQVLAGAFQHARMKSIQEGKSYGIKLIPFDTAQTVAVQLLMQKGGTVNMVNPSDVRVKVEEGKIVPYRFDGGTGTWQPLDLASFDVQEGDQIQFNLVGRWYEVGGRIDEGFRLVDLENPEVDYGRLNLPDDSESNGAMEYRITRSLERSLAWLPPMVMPRGTVVDLVFSGGETVNFNGEEKMPGDGIPYRFPPGEEIVVMFSPAGHVDLLYVNGASEKVNEMLYFCVGGWDRQVDAEDNALAEDGQSNLDIPATYWVSLHPKTGGVRIAENAPVQRESTTRAERLRDARKFVREHFFNAGGY